MPMNNERELELELQQADTHAKKLRLWTIGVALATSALLIAATLLVVFFPPATAIILPILAAIGNWSILILPILLLTAFLPTFCLNAARKTQVGNCERLQSILDNVRNSTPNNLFNYENGQNVSEQFAEAGSSSRESLTNQPSGFNALRSGNHTHYGDLYQAAPALSNNGQQQAFPRSGSTPNLSHL
jgi:hypothetical protein